MNDNSFIPIIILACMILMSSYFSATETAFSSMSKIRLKNKASKGNKKASLVLELAKDYDKILSTILIGNNIVNIASASLSTVLFVSYFGDAGVTISTIVMTVLVLIFGEISPKSLAKEAPESFAMFSAPFLKILSVFLMPLNRIFILWKRLLSQLIKVRDSKAITEAELITIVETATQDGGIQQDEGDLIRSAIEFNDLDVIDVFTPRTKMVAVEEKTSENQIRDIFIESGLSRLPVYRNNIDSIIGVIHLKDLYNNPSCTISELIKRPLFVPDSIKIPKLMRLIQESKSHLAFVTDEYGGTLGIVTLEDIIEELVGEIWDEHDEVVKEFEQISEHEYRINGSASLDKMFRLLNIDQEEPDAATVNGWIIKQLGRIPVEDDSFDFENLRTTVISANGKRATQIMVTVLPKEIDLILKD
ncbi:hemolysin family protein [Sinanaerobacter sp. ZZT-01]|uniref:HlyC/CorC family transporter n=1 Tax=Sinanaerobacter sp. ZZT-01 TaxID=3111540 RepID=UPI002D77EA7C|nr:hemolysin family protein [Sinanaerobacter sp. ZZT-01]WRR94714.1 hemolysin family protein [Sinanaerobacter sp. ZZT-01]